MELNIGNKKIEQLFAEFFGLDSSYIHQCYREFKDAYNQKLSLPHEGFIPKQKQSWKISFQEKQTLNNWENSPLIGVDLPLFFKSPESEAQTVMLVALDPLRNPKHFSDFKHEDVIIGTPFAQHSSYYREKQQKIVFNFIKHIVAKNYHLYVTDIYKVWMKNPLIVDKNEKHKLNKESTIFGELLLKEIEIIKPKKIICFGTSDDGAYHFCKDLLKDNDLESELLPALLHPSGMNTKWNDMFSPNAENKIKYLNNKIDEYLD